MRRNSSVANSSAQSNSLSGAGRRNLKKNQACLQCRRGKMRCDAAQPHCTNCVKAWQLAVETTGEGPSVPDRPTCSYDPVEGLVFTPENIPDPGKRIRAIQEQIAQLRGRLDEAKQESGQSSSRPGSSSGSQSNSKRRSTLGASLPRRASAGSSDGSSRSYTVGGAGPSSGQSPNQGMWTAMPISATHQNPDIAGSFKVDLADSESRHTKRRVPSLPPTDILRQMLDIYFEKDPHASRFLHLDSIRARLSITPAVEDPRSISPALIHAICAASCRFVSEELLQTFIHPDAGPVSQPGSYQGTQNTILTDPSASSHRAKEYAQSHVVYARQLLNSALSEHQHVGLLDTEAIRPSTEMDIDPDEEAERLKTARDTFTFKHVLQPLLVLATFFYGEARGAEMWSTVGAAVRTGMALGLNRPPMEEFLISPSSPGAANSQILIEERKRAFWMCFVLDRLVSIGGWTHSLAEADSVAHYRGTKPLLSAQEFRDLGSRMQSPHFPTTKPSNSFCLLSDAAFLLGRVTEFNIRRLMRSKTLRAPSSRPSSSSSSSGSSNATGHVFTQNSFGMRNTPDPLLTWDFRELDMTLAKGVEGFGNATVQGNFRPAAIGGHDNSQISARFKFPIGVVDRFVSCETESIRRPSLLSNSSISQDSGNLNDGVLDTDLYVAHLIPHAATILLHIPFARFDREPASPESAPHPPPFYNITQGNPPVSHAPSIFGGPSFSLHQGPPGSHDYAIPSTQIGLADDGTVASTSKCLKSARRVLDALMLIKATAFDLTLLHPFVTTCWYLAAVVLVHEYKRVTDEGKDIPASSVRQEIQLLQQALQQYASRSAIGAYHDSQLSAIINSVMVSPPAPESTPPSSRQRSRQQSGETGMMGLLMPEPEPFAFSSQSITRTSSPSPSIPSPPSIFIPLFPFDTEPHNSQFTSKSGFGQAAPLPDILIDEHES